VDYKTGDARLSKRQKAGAKRAGVPLAKLTKNSDLVNDVAKVVATQRRSSSVDPANRKKGGPAQRSSPRTAVGWAQGIVGVSGLATEAIDIYGDFERGEKAKAVAKTGTTVLSQFSRSTPLTITLSAAWGALEHSKNPVIRSQGDTAGDFVSDKTRVSGNFLFGSQSGEFVADVADVAGAGTAAVVNTNLSVSAAAKDMAEYGFKSSFVGMLGCGVGWWDCFWE